MWCTINNTTVCQEINAQSTDKRTPHSRLTNTPPAPALPRLVLHSYYLQGELFLHTLATTVKFSRRVFEHAAQSHMMATIAQNLADVGAAVGEDNISFLPFINEIEFSPQSQMPKAFQFKLLYGTVSDNRQVWVYLLTNTDRSHELQFGLSSHKGNELKVWIHGDRPMIETIGKVQAVQRAFQDVVELNKIQSLATYIFLVFMIECHCKDEELEVPFDVAGTWIANLRTVCSDF